MKVILSKKETIVDVLQIEHGNFKIQISSFNPEVITVTEIGKASNKIIVIPIATNCFQIKVI